MKNVVLPVLLMFCCVALAQRAQISKGDIWFESYEYSKAIHTYNKALEKSKDTLEMQYVRGRIALCYAYLFQYEKAEVLFKQVIENGKTVSPEMYLEYGHVLKLNGKYAEAKKQYIQYRGLKHSNEVDVLIQSVDWAMNNAEAVNSRYRVFVTNLDVSGQALGYCYYGEGLAYCHARNKIAGNNTKPVFDIDYAIGENTLEFVERRNFFPKINFAGNEISPSITKDEQQLFFAANAENIRRGKSTHNLDADKLGIAHFKIYVASKHEAEFTNITALPFNNVSYSCMHPFIVNDGKTLLFSSDKPGGFGGFDLYKSTLSEEGIWSDPVNLGATVNSPENEIFPWVSGGNLYFSSKGFYGYGGYDVFIAELSETITPHSLKNMGLPVNSFRDEVAYITNDSGRSGYFSSNRNTDNGADQVYFFKSSEEGVSFAAVSGFDSRGKLVVADGLTPGALQSIDRKQLVGFRSDDPKAKEQQVSTVEKSKAISASSGSGGSGAKEVIPQAVGATAAVTLKPETVVAIPPEKKKTAMSHAETITQEFTPILFKFNDAKITTAQKELADSVIQLFNQNPKATIFVKAYTDSRGSTSYNIELSKRRAASLKQYLIEHAIPAARIKIVALGESELLNVCRDGVICSDQQHALNRRVVITLQGK